jgi:mRNA-degrading endonuclease toxin of MazEF toxin-antitoxin module
VAFAAGISFGRISTILCVANRAANGARFSSWTSIAMPQQVRTIDKARLREKIGSLTNTDLQIQIEDRLLEHLGIAFDLEDI